MTDDANSNDGVTTNPEILDSLVEDFTKRLRMGEHPPIEEYQQKHPALKDEIEDLLASVAMIESFKTSASITPSPNRRSLDEVSKLENIANYEIKKELGRGGMGVVFEAVHESLGRRVAIKVMPTPLVNSEKYIERFKREAKAAAKLHHTNIVGVFEVGEAENYHYYVMDFVDGQGLNEVIKELKKSTGKQTSKNDEVSSNSALNSNGAIADFEPTSIGHFRWAARIGANLADAISYAHQSNILHRDIKPSNMILDRKGTVWITDFGLAKDTSGEINLTKTGDVIGTPQYLAPESLEGDYDQKSEVYCLGLTLYELATLQPAFKNGSTAEVIRAIANSKPISPRKVNPKIPIDLSTIIAKAIERNPDSRYKSAEEMKNDLNAFIQDQPISARPPSTLENVWKWCRRRPMEAALSLTTGLLVATVAIGSSVAYYYQGERLVVEKENAKRLEIRTKEVSRHVERAEEARSRAFETFDNIIEQVYSHGDSPTSRSDFEPLELLAGINSSVGNASAEYLQPILEYYDQFATLNFDNRYQWEEAATALRQTAKLNLLIGENEKARLALEETTEIYHSILTEKPLTKTNVLAEQAQALSDLTKCDLTKSTSDQATAQDSLRVAKKYFASMLELLESTPLEKLGGPRKLELAHSLVTLGTNLSFAQERLGRDPEHKQIAIKLAQQYNRAAIQILDSLDNENPEVAANQSLRATAYLSLAESLRKENPSLAAETRDLAIDDLNKLIETDPSNPLPRFQHGVALSLQFKSDTDFQRERLLSAAVEVADKLKQSFPQHLNYHQLHANSSLDLSAEYLRRNNLPKSAELLSEAIDSIEHIVNQSPENQIFQCVTRANELSQQLATAAKSAKQADVVKQAEMLIKRSKFLLK